MNKLEAKVILDFGEYDMSDYYCTCGSKTAPLFEDECPFCNGFGFLENKTEHCDACNGRGTLQDCPDCGKVLENDD